MTKFRQIVRISFTGPVQICLTYHLSHEHNIALKILRTILLFFLISCAYQVSSQIIEHRTTINLNNGKLTKVQFVCIQINSPEDDWLSEVRISYDRKEEVEILEAAIYGINKKQIRKLKKNEITNRSSNSNGTFFEDDYEKQFSLTWKTYPYQIKYSYSIQTDRYLFISRWTPYLYQSVSVNEASLSIDLPIDFAINKNYSPEFKYNSNQSSSRITHHWTISNLLPLNSEVFAPSFWERCPKVEIVPIDFKYGLKGSFASWSDYGNWQAQMNSDLEKIPEEELKILEKLVGDQTDKKEIARILYHYLQDNTRYINVAIDVGGLKPFAPAFVSKNKYGDCKALSFYLKSMLAHFGIPAFYCKIYAGKTPVPINIDFPSQQFNHVILCVPIGNDTIWLENTASYLPFNYLGSFIQNRIALLVEDEKSRLIRTPKTSTTEALVEEHHSYIVKPFNNSEARIQTTEKGIDFEQSKYLLIEKSEQELKKAYSKKYASSNFQLDKWSIDSFGRDDDLLKINLKLNCPQLIREVANIEIIKLPSLELPKLESPSERATDLVVNFPIHFKNSYNYDLSEIATSNTSFSIPASKEIKNEFGKYFTSFALKGTVVTVHREFQLRTGTYNLEQYSAFYKFIKQVDALNNAAQIIIKKEP